MEFADFRFCHTHRIDPPTHVEFCCVCARPLGLVVYRYKPDPDEKVLVGSDKSYLEVSDVFVVMTPLLSPSCDDLSKTPSFV